MKLFTRGRQLLAGLALVTAAGLVLAGCSANGAEGGGDAGRTDITIAVSADPRSLLGTSSTVQSEVTLSEQITEKLVMYSPDGSGFEPRLATEWEQISPNTVRLKLREGVTFTNGEAFNAESAKASVEHLIAAPAYSSFTTMLDKVEIVDEHTIDVSSDEPSGMIVSALADGSFQLPLEYFAEVGEDGFGTAPIGTGPYVFEQWLSGDRIEMSANPDYWDGAPEITKLTWQVLPDKAAQVAALQSGQVQLMTDLPVGSWTSVENADNIELVAPDSNRVFYLAFSTLTETPLREPAVRQALQYAIDAQSILDQQLGGRGKLLEGQLLPENFTGFTSQLNATPYDPDRAKKMLAEAGYADGFEITFKYSSGRYAQDKEIGEAVSDQLAKVGVTVKQEVLEPGTFLTQLTSLELNDMFFMGALTPPDGHMLLQQFRTDAVYSYYSNPSIDAKLDAVNSVVDSDERAAKLGEISVMYSEDPAFRPLFQGVDAYGVAKGLTFTTRASQFIDVKSMSFEN